MELTWFGVAEESCHAELCAAAVLEIKEFAAATKLPSRMSPPEVNPLPEFGFWVMLPFVCTMAITKSLVLVVVTDAPVITLPEPVPFP
jgi:hypothetical protein